MEIYLAEIASMTFLPGDRQVAGERSVARARRRTIRIRAVSCDEPGRAKGKFRLLRTEDGWGQPNREAVLTV